jgi:hypothetical protein
MKKFSSLDGSGKYSAPDYSFHTRKAIAYLRKEGILQV